VGVILEEKIKKVFPKYANEVSGKPSFIKKGYQA
jgi:hypothetical protein